MMWPFRLRRLIDRPTNPSPKFDPNFTVGYAVRYATPRTRTQLTITGRTREGGTIQVLKVIPDVEHVQIHDSGQWISYVVRVDGMPRDHRIGWYRIPDGAENVEFRRDIVPTERDKGA